MATIPSYQGKVPQWFDAAFYAKENPDLLRRLGQDPNVLYQHYNTYGVKENRRPSATLAGGYSGEPATAPSVSPTTQAPLPPSPGSAPGAAAPSGGAGGGGAIPPSPPPATVTPPATAPPPATVPPVTGAGAPGPVPTPSGSPVAYQGAPTPQGGAAPSSTPPTTKPATNPPGVTDPIPAFANRETQLPTWFDAAYYAKANPDAARVVGTDPSALYYHYKYYGIGEGRKPSDQATAGYFTKTTPTTPPTGTTTGGVPPPTDIPTTPGPPLTTPQVPLGNTATADPMQQAVRQQITSLLGQNLNQASVADPDLAPQAQTYSAARERARRQQQEQDIERLGAQGLASSGATNAAVAQGAETAGQDVAQYEAGLVGEKLNTRRQMLTNAIESASKLGMAEEAHNLTRQLANVDAQIKMQGMGLSREQMTLNREIANMDTQTKTYLANLDADLRKQGYGVQERLAKLDNELRKYGIDVQGNLGALQVALGFAGLLTQNQQWYDQFGANLGMFEFLKNNEVLNGLFG